MEFQPLELEHFGNLDVAVVGGVDPLGQPGNVVLERLGVTSNSPKADIFFAARELVAQAQSNVQSTGPGCSSRSLRHQVFCVC